MIVVLRQPQVVILFLHFFECCFCSKSVSTIATSSFFNNSIVVQAIYRLCKEIFDTNFGLEITLVLASVLVMYLGKIDLDLLKCDIGKFWGCNIPLLLLICCMNLIQQYNYPIEINFLDTTRLVVVVKEMHYNIVLLNTPFFHM